MTFFFRVNFNNEIGLGHLARCSKLSSYIESNLKKDVVFISNASDIKNISFLKLPKIEIINPLTLEDDVRLTNEILAKYGGSKILFVDSYEIDQKWETLIKPYCDCLIVIDDLANRIHDCHLLTDCSPVRAEADYSDLLVSETKLLLGLDYCLISSDVAELKNIPSIPGKVHLFFGSAVKPEEVFAYFKAFQEKFPEFTYNIAISEKLSQSKLSEWNEHLRATDSLFMSEPLSKSLKSCSISFGAPGIATWDRLYLNMISFYITTHQNQIEVLSELQRKGFSFIVGSVNDSIQTNLNSFGLKVKSVPENFLSAVSKVVDGRGIERIIQEALSYEK